MGSCLLSHNRDLDTLIKLGVAAHGPVLHLLQELAGLILHLPVTDSDGCSFSMWKMKTSEASGQKTPAVFLMARKEGHLTSQVYWF